MIYIQVTSENEGDLHLVHISNVQLDRSMTADDYLLWEVQSVTVAKFKDRIQAEAKANEVRNILVAGMHGDYPVMEFI